MNQPDNMTLLGTLAKSRSENEPAFDWLGTLGRGLLLMVVVLSPWAFGSVYSWAQCAIAAGKNLPKPVDGVAPGTNINQTADNVSNHVMQTNLSLLCCNITIRFYPIR